MSALGIVGTTNRRTCAGSEWQTLKNVAYVAGVVGACIRSGFVVQFLFLPHFLVDYSLFSYFCSMDE